MYRFLFNIVVIFNNNTFYIALLTKTKLKILSFKIDENKMDILKEFDNDKYIIVLYVFIVT